jgi:hypothetical protein
MCYKFKGTPSIKFNKNQLQHLPVIKIDYDGSNYRPLQNLSWALIY